MRREEERLGEREKRGDGKRRMVGKLKDLALDDDHDDVVLEEVVWMFSESEE